MHLSTEEQALATTVGLEPHRLLRIKEEAGAPLSSLTLTDPEGERRVGVLTRAAHHDAARRLVRALNGWLAGTPWRAFILASDYTSDDRADLLDLSDAEAQRRHDNVVGVLPCGDDDDILRLRRTEARTQDLGTDDLLGRLSQWRRRASFAVIGAGRSWLELDFHTLPADLEGFSAEVYDLCPEAVYIGDYHTLTSPDEVGSPLDAPDITELLSEGEERDALESLRDHLETTKRLFLWWS